MRKSKVKTNSLMQKFNYDCIVLCLCRLMNESYDIIYNKINLTQKGYRYIDLKKFLNQENIKYIFKKKTCIKEKKKIVLFHLKEQPKNWGHYVYIDENEDFYDPQKKAVINSNYKHYDYIICSFNFI